MDGNLQKCRKMVKMDGDELFVIPVILPACRSTFRQGAEHRFDQQAHQQAEGARKQGQKKGNQPADQPKQRQLKSKQERYAKMA